MTVKILATALVLAISSPAYAVDVPWFTRVSEPSPDVSREPQISELKRLNTTFTDLAAQVSPAVVSIYTKSSLRRSGVPGTPKGPGDAPELYFNHPFSQRPMALPPRESLGSGFVINAEEGYIVTNAHVIRTIGRDADEILVKFVGEERSKGHPARVLGVDEISDVALIQLTEKKPGLKAIPLGDSGQSKVGEWVLAVGNPYGHSHTVTQGIVSAMGRNLEGVRSDFLQTSASINPGNSGGPLINVDGEVIGINTAIDPRAQGIGFAIPINTAKKVIADLASKGRVARAWMGIAIEDVTDEVAGLMRLKETGGVLVREVMPNQAAAKAGMEPYDVITKINGEEVKTVHDLYRQVEKLQIGQTAKVEVLRGAQAKNLKVQMREQPVASAS